MPYIGVEVGGGFSQIVPTAASVIGNWNSGVATSGAAGADLVTIGVNDAKRGIHSALVNISELTAGATITVRMYVQINGTARLVYTDTFVQGTDPDGLWIINSAMAIHEALRIEVSSNNALDDGLAIDYDYLLES